VGDRETDAMLTAKRERRGVVARDARARSFTASNIARSSVSGRTSQ
jgi:hypothetical protein